MDKVIFQTVVKTFGTVKAIDGLDIQINEGEVYALLGDEYRVDALTAVLSGKKEHTPGAKSKYAAKPKHGTLLIDIDAKLQAGKGIGFERWAKIKNLKQIAQMVNYLREHNLLDYDELERKTVDASARFNTLSAKIKDFCQEFSEKNKS